MDYQTIAAPAEDRFIERRSEFIGYIAPVKTAEEATDFIESVRAMHRKATHNVYAYLLRDGSLSRYSDDGEPQGTAGVPVLEVLRKEGLTDVCCVVTRYFGGILLGGGGLVRAYSHGAKIAVDAAKRMIMCACSNVKFTSDYNLYGKITNILPEFEVKSEEPVFGEAVEISLFVRSHLIKPLTDKLTDISNGKLSFEISNEMYMDFS